MMAHDVLVRGFATGPSGRSPTPPTLLERTDQDFIPAVLGELRSAQGRESLLGTTARQTANNILRLFQPVQRTFHVALIEVACDSVGTPRLDPVRIESAGLVVRREALGSTGGATPDVLEGWREDAGTLRGWIPFADDRETGLDPDPVRRHVPSAGHPELDRRLSLLQAALGPLAESTAPLFVAPPDVCQAAKKTILYGLVPVTSSELSTRPAGANGASVTPTASTGASDPLQFLREHVATYLRPSSGTKRVPYPNAVLSASDATRVLAAGKGATGEEDSLLWDYIDMLRQLALELNAFGETPEAKALHALLDTIQLPYQSGSGQYATYSTRAAGAELQRATRVLVDRVAGEEVRMPRYWPSIPFALGESIITAAKGVLDTRLAAVKQHEARYGDARRQYRVRAFVRVRQPDGCPDHTVWSDYSEPFTIAPWYEGNGVPAAPVQLPDITDAFLKKVKPNVSFAVPDKLFNFLRANDPKSILEGKAKKADASGLNWICGFNIPIITICAFIVLNIFLALLHMVFFWLPFVKICIPFPPLPPLPTGLGVPEPPPEE